MLHRESQFSTTLQTAKGGEMPVHIKMIPFVKRPPESSVPQKPQSIEAPKTVELRGNLLKFYSIKPAVAKTSTGAQMVDMKPLSPKGRYPGKFYKLH